MADDETQIDESPDDLTVYDLAEKIAAGQHLSDQANIEIEAERHRIVNALHDLVASTEFWAETPQGNAVELLRIKAELERILKP